ncbi:hypothetical protein JVU11DRAFT_10798 [Chiua virens]|nr:hypothetical protein JVU11DRAFT_10798 [Chiua virens]
MAASLDAGIDSEPEADPNGNEWEDLNAEDGGDPLMVSENINEIFDYMKQTKVSAFFYIRRCQLIPVNTLIRTTCRVRRSSHGQCEASYSIGSYPTRGPCSLLSPPRNVLPLCQHHRPLPLNLFLHRFPRQVAVGHKADDYDVKAHTIGKYPLEVGP